MFPKNQVYSAEKSQYILQCQEIIINSTLVSNAQMPFSIPDWSNNVFYNHPFLLSPKSNQGHLLYLVFKSLYPPSMWQNSCFFLSFLTWHLKSIELLLCWMTFNLWLTDISSRLLWGHTFLAGITQTWCCVLLSGSYWGYSISGYPTVNDLDFTTWLRWLIIKYFIFINNLKVFEWLVLN